MAAAESHLGNYRRTTATGSTRSGGSAYQDERHIMTTGTVKFFNATRGFGFISPDDGSKDVFVHVTAVEQAGMTSIAEGQKLNFEVQSDARGPKAVNLAAAD
jgi:CspA family cold shock protein